MAEAETDEPTTATTNGARKKLHGRAFYESMGSPKVILAPMVDQSEFAWRMLSRSYMPETKKSDLLAYTPMFHARLFADTPRYRESAFQPTKSPLPDPPRKVGEAISDEEERNLHLDGNPKMDRPLFVQFCANDPDKLLAAAQLVQPYCDAVDLNLGCPQGIARKGHYGAFLQEDQDLIFRLINNLHKNLDIPVTAKMRILDTREKTLDYAKMILSAGASLITVHGRQRYQKGHNTGTADWSVLKYLREQLPPETVLFANGNILQHEDIQASLAATGFDGVMSAEGNLHDPTIFGTPPGVGEEGQEYWRGRDGKGGYRMDAVMRRYMAIIYKYVLKKPEPERKPLFLALDRWEQGAAEEEAGEDDAEEEGPPRKKTKSEKKQHRTSDPNLTAMQAHLFQMLRPLITKHTHVRDALARARAGDIEAFERVLSLVEQVTREGIVEYERQQLPETATANGGVEKAAEEVSSKDDSFRTLSREAMERCKRPWWVCQPYIRPLPEEAIAKGAMSVSKKEKKRQEAAKTEEKKGDVATDGAVKKVLDEAVKDQVEVPKEAMVCG